MRPSHTATPADQQSWPDDICRGCCRVVKQTDGRHPCLTFGQPVVLVFSAVSSAGVLQYKTAATVVVLLQRRSPGNDG
jgi:hypothetical protein